VAGRERAEGEGQQWALVVQEMEAAHRQLEWMTQSKDDEIAVQRAKLQQVIDEQDIQVESGSKAHDRIDISIFHPL
jgi:hypothetical protein